MPDKPDEYAGNPQLASTQFNPDDGWTMFLVAATHALVPHARNGVDFVVARKDKDSPLENVHWDEELLGPRPDAEIEEEARRLAGGQPANVDPQVIQQ